jgi:hypothetical protein
MYREQASRSASEEAPRELVYVVAPRDRSSSAATMFKLFSLPLLAATLLAMVTPNAGFAGLVGGAAWSWWSWRRGKSDDRVVLRVEDGVLAIGPVGEEKARIRLTDLADVSLDGRSIQPVQEGGSAIPAMRFLDSKVGPEVDVARIVLVRSDMPDLPLTAEHVAHMEATEWLGKIRVFLRKHGWVPQDESAAASESEP